MTNEVHTYRYKLFACVIGKMEYLMESLPMNMCMKSEQTDGKAQNEKGQSDLISWKWKHLIWWWLPNLLAMVAIYSKKNVT